MVRSPHPPFPIDEAARLRALRALGVLDAPPDAALDALVRSAARALGCPIALLSLVDADRQRVKACFGIEAFETPREAAFCAHTICGDGPFEVPDAARDPRFAASPLVAGPPGVRFYAGMPLQVDGRAVGALCVLDRVPHRLDAAQREALVDLARAAEQCLRHQGQDLELRAAEAYGSQLFEQIGDGALLLDADLQVVDANAAALSMLGHRRDALCGRGLRELFAAHDHARLSPWTTDEAEGAAPPAAELDCLHQDGRHVPVEARLRRLDAQRRVLILRDLRARHTQDRQLRLLSQAAEQCAESIVIADAALRIEYVNAAALATLGYTRDEMTGRDARAVLGGGKRRYKWMLDLLHKGKAAKGLLQSRHKNGTLIDEFAVVTPIRDARGRITHYLAVKEDVTEKRRMGAELDRYRHHLEELVEQRTAELELAKKAAEAANEAKSAFLAMMSHEIRTPMNGVVGTVDVLRQSTLTPYQTELTDTIRDSAFALLALIDDILDFSKIEAGRMTLEARPIAPQEGIEQTCEGLLAAAQACQVRLHCFVDPRVPRRMLGDPLRLRQLLNNIAGNAIKFSAGLGRPGRVRVSAVPDADGGLCLRVEDNGIGMSDEVQARIFRPFVQADGATTRRFGGTGLGLSICARLVEMFGGRIEVDSTPGRGSAITVRLPLPTVADDEDGPWTETPDLGGLACHLVLGDPAQAADWGVYLTAAGASAQAWPSADALPAGLTADAVVIEDVGVDADADAAWPAVPRVSVRPGVHRGPQAAGPGRALLHEAALRRQSLLQAVAIAAGRGCPAPIAYDPVPAVPAPAPAGTRQRVLVAEDNDINRKVIERQLALLGIEADIVVDGTAAYERWRSGHHTLLLTDLHMPGIDGYELVARIRREEDPARRLPIVALTANALSGEEARCLAAGMDAYLSKPVRLDELGAALARWLPAPAAMPERPPATDVDAPPDFDEHALGRLIGGDAHDLEAFRADFVISTQDAAEQLRRAVQRGDAVAAGFVAHRLKSGARALGAFALGARCERIETLAQDGPVDALDAELRCFEVDLARLLARLAGSGPAAPQPARAASAEQASVLLLDDDAQQLKLLQRQLSQLVVGPVHGCSDGAAALQWLRGRDSSRMLLMLDLNMPGMDGVEFMRHLARIEYAGALVLVSGSDARVLDSAGRLAQVHKLAVLDRLHKPVDNAQLQALVERWRAFRPQPIGAAIKVYDAAALEAAIAGDQLLLHYQPKVSLRDGAWVGVEALVRWQHPSDGLLFPDRFVALAEASGRIDALTRRVIGLALAQARRWRDAGHELRMAVNVSMDNLTRLDFPDFVVDEAARHGVPTTDLVLEVTESRLMGDARAPLDNLTRLRLKRIRLSIDDFGTGHSSLAQLRDMPFDELKIDRGFVHDSHRDATLRAILVASLEMAHQLGMPVVAEGVEDRADWDFVRSAGCDIAQGYFIGKPLPADALDEWAARWRRRLEQL